MPGSRWHERRPECGCPRGPGRLGRGGRRQHRFHRLSNRSFLAHHLESGEQWGSEIRTESANGPSPGRPRDGPPLRAKQESRPTDLVHRFKRKGVPAEIAFVLRDKDGAPIPNRTYRLRVGSRLYQGSTNPQGGLRHYVLPVATRAILELESDDPSSQSPQRWTIAIGRLAPKTSRLGIQQRLINLGYLKESEAEIGSPDVQAAILRFLSSQGLDTDSDEDTLADALDRVHGQ